MIDYYHDESKDKGLDTPPAPSAADKSVTSITVSVRPASDSIANIWQRAKMAVRSWAPRFGTASTAAAAAPAVAAPAAPVTFPNAVLGDDEFKFLSSLDLAKVNELNARVREKCTPLAAAHAESLGTCGGGVRSGLPCMLLSLLLCWHAGEPDAVVQRAQMALTCCISSIVCPQATTQFLELLDKDGVDPTQPYQALEERVARYWHQSKKVRELQAAPARAAAPPAKLQE